jgi:hypothetical protein
MSSQKRQIKQEPIHLLLVQIGRWNNGGEGGNASITQKEKPSSFTSREEGDVKQVAEKEVARSWSAKSGSHAKVT